MSLCASRRARDIVAATRRTQLKRVNGAATRVFNIRPDHNSADPDTLSDGLPTDLNQRGKTWKKSLRRGGNSILLNDGFYYIAVNHTTCFQCVELCGVPAIHFDDEAGRQQGMRIVRRHCCSVA